MASMIDNIGLDFYRDDEESFMNLLSYFVQEGKTYVGYSGIPYIYKDTGTSEFWISLERNEEEKQLSVLNVHTHGGNRSVVDFKHSGFDISPKDTKIDEHIGMLNLADGSAGFIPVDIINADILPSLMENDDIRLQIIAYPLEINYYSDEDEYNESLPKDEHGKTWGIAKGSLMPLQFLANHKPENYEENKEYDTDRYVHFTAEVKELYHGTFVVGENKINSYIRCFADTNYGEIEFAHSIDFVSEDRQKNIKIGSLIDGVCIISGDAAIDEYQDGAVFDLDHDLKLLRYVLSEGKFEKLKGVITNKTKYTTHNSNNIFEGQDEIIGKIKRVYDVHHQKDIKYYVHLATIVRVEDEGLEYPVGTKCLVLAYEEEDNYKSILFIDVDEDGKIENIKILDDFRYHFNINNPEEPELDLEDIKAPDSVIEALLLRGKFVYNVLQGDEVDTDAFVKDIDIYDYNMFKNNAQRFLEDLKENKQHDIETALENSFGYLFAKAIEHEYNSNTRISSDCKDMLLSSYIPADAFAGRIESSLEDSMHKILEKTMDSGKGFYKDFKNFLMMQEDEIAFEDLYTTSAIVVQRLGQLYLDNFLRRLEENSD